MSDNATVTIPIIFSSPDIGKICAHILDAYEHGKTTVPIALAMQLATHAAGTLKAIDSLAERPTRRHGVIRCARCGQDHERLEFRLFSQPVVDEDGTIWDRWAMCPETGDPILATDIYGDAQ